MSKKKELKNLDAYNELMWLKYNRKIGEPTLNGFGCPKCGFELMDTNELKPIIDWPFNKKVKCSDEGCSYEGLRFV